MGIPFCRPASNSRIAISSFAMPGAKRLVHPQPTPAFLSRNPNRVALTGS